MEPALPDPAAGEFRLAGRVHHGSGGRGCRLGSPLSPCKERRARRRGSGQSHSSHGATRVTRFLIPLGVFALLAIVLAVGVRHSTQNGTIKSPLIGKPVPDFALPKLEDPKSTVSASDLKGHWYLINVWGVWCATCHEEHPWLMQYQKQDVLPIIGVDWNDQDADARQFLSQQGNPYTHVITDHDGRTAINLGVYAAPESFLVNPAGIVVYKCP